MRDLFIGELRTLFKGKYRIVEKIGKGGTGRVYKAVNNDGIEVALKIIRSDYVDSEVSVKRVKREIETASRIDNSNVVKINSIGEIGELWYIEMELVDGDNLLNKIRSGSLKTEEKISITRDIINGLEAIHDAGIIHRDVKPSNIVVDSRGRAVITDFGLARAEDMSQLSRTAVYSGTPQYTAPEIWKGGGYSVQTDIYSLGMLLYELFYGVLPFTSDSDYGYLNKHLFETVTFPENEDVSRNIRTVIDKALDKKVRNRYKKMKFLTIDIRGTDKNIKNRAVAVIGLGLFFTVLFMLLYYSSSNFIYLAHDESQAPVKVKILFRDKSWNETFRKKGEILRNQIAHMFKRPINIKTELKLNDKNIPETIRIAEVTGNTNYDYLLELVTTKSGKMINVDCFLRPALEQNLWTARYGALPEKLDLLHCTDSVKKMLLKHILSEKYNFIEQYSNSTTITTSTSIDKLKHFIDRENLFGDKNYCTKKKWYVEIMDKNHDISEILDEIDSLHKSEAVADAQTTGFHGELDYKNTLSLFARFYESSEYRNDMNLEKLHNGYKELYAKYKKKNPIMFDILSSHFTRYWLWRHNVKLFNDCKEEKVAANSYAKLIYTYFRTGELTKCEEFLRIAGQIGTRHSKRQQWQYYILKKKFRKAEETGDEIIYDEMGSPESRRVKGLTYLWNGDMKLAAEEFRKIHKKSSYGTGVLFHKMSFALNMYCGRYRKAQKDVQSLFRLSLENNQLSDLVEALSLRIRLDIIADKFRGKQDIGRYYTYINPDKMSYADNLKLQGMLLKAYLNRKQIENACGIYLKYINNIKFIKTPAEKIFKRYLYEEIELAALRGGRSRMYEELVESYYHEADIWGENHHALFLQSLAEAYRYEKRTTNELRIYRKIQQLTFGALYYGDIYTRSFYHCGRIYYKRRKWKKAEKEFKTFLNLWKEGDRDVFPEIEKAEEKLEYIREKLRNRPGDTGPA